MRINLDKLTIFLLCIYLALIPFERVLEYTIGLETFFKPYRIAGIVLIVIGTLSAFRKNKYTLAYPLDKYLLGIYIIGAFVTTIYCLWGFASWYWFLNELTQVIFLLLIFFVIKSFKMTEKRMVILMNSFILGMVINTGFIIFEYYVLGLRYRQAGFMGNPNYVALSSVVVTAYLLYRISNARKNWRKILNVSIIIYLFLGILATGSRSGIVILAVVFLSFSFLFSNFKTRLIVTLLTPLLIVAMIPYINKAKEERTMVLLNRMEATDVKEEQRTDIWKASLLTIPDRLGMGLGMSQTLNMDIFYPYFKKFDPRYAKKRLDKNKGLSVHNDFLNYLVNYGFIPFILYLVYVSRTGQILLRQFQQNVQNKITVFRLTCFLVLMFYSLNASNTISPPYLFFLAICTIPATGFLPTSGLMPGKIGMRRTSQ